LKTKMRSKAGLILSAATIFVLIAVAAASARQAAESATPFTGKWVAQTVTNNITRETTYFLTQNGNTLTGAILTGYRMQDIADGTVNGNEASWAVIMGNGDQQRKIDYPATL
jgi:hypothetical protein